MTTGGREPNHDLMIDWFEELLGFAELPYEETKRRIEVVGTALRSKVSGKSFGIGHLETPSLGELRKRAQAR